MNNKADIVVVGVGNVLMSDEGIGVVLFRRLLEKAGHFTGIDFLEAGSALMPIVHAIEGRKKAVILDCALMGEEPGTLRRFNPEHVRSVKDLPGLSLHEGDVMGALALSDSLGEIPNEIVIFGVEPLSVEIGSDLSEALQARLPEYDEAILRELAPYEK